MLNTVLFHVRITNCKTLEILNLELRKVVSSGKNHDMTHISWWKDFQGGLWALKIFKEPTFL